MATSITKSPPELVFSGNCIVWCIQSSDIGDDTIIKYSAYQLVDDSGNPITALKSILPRAVGADECINFQSNLRRAVFTSIPIPEASVLVLEDTNAIKKIKLKYGTIEVDLEECSNSVNVESESEVVTLINCAIPEFISSESLLADDAFIMSDRPIVNEFTHYSHDWMWIYGGSGVVITAFNAFGNDVYEQTLLTADGKVNIVPIGVIQHNMPASTVKFKVEVNIGTGSKTFWFYEKCQPCEEFTEVLFLEQKGGRATVIFDCDRSFVVSSTAQKVALATPCLDPVGNSSGIDRSILSKYGESNADKRAFRQITLTKILNDDLSIIEWYSQFLSSNNHHIKVKLPDGTCDYRKINLQTGGSGIFQDGEFTFLRITGEYHIADNLPNGLI